MLSCYKVNDYKIMTKLGFTGLPNKIRRPNKNRPNRWSPERKSMDEECCICFNHTTNLINPCGHLMCKDCILKWCDKRICCPICKTTLLSPCPMSDLESTKSPTVYFGVAPSQKVGVTITNRSNPSERGVRVKNVTIGGLAMVHGLKKGHIVTHINDIPVKNHGDAIAIINQAQCYGHPLRFTMFDPDLPRKKPLSPRGHWKKFVDNVITCLRSPRTAPSPSSQSPANSRSESPATPQ